MMSKQQMQALLPHQRLNLLNVSCYKSNNNVENEAKTNAVRVVSHWRLPTDNHECWEVALEKKIIQSISSDLRHSEESQQVPMHHR